MVHQAPVLIGLKRHSQYLVTPAAIRRITGESNNELLVVPGREYTHLHILLPLRLFNRSKLEDHLENVGIGRLLSISTSN